MAKSARSAPKTRCQGLNKVPLTNRSRPQLSQSWCWNKSQSRRSHQESRNSVPCRTGRVDSTLYTNLDSIGSSFGPLGMCHLVDDVENACVFLQSELEGR